MYKPKPFPLLDTLFLKSSRTVETNLSRTDGRAFAAAAFVFGRASRHRSCRTYFRILARYRLSIYIFNFNSSSFSASSRSSLWSFGALSRYSATFVRAAANIFASATASYAKGHVGSEGYDKISPVGAATATGSAYSFTTFVAPFVAYVAPFANFFSDYSSTSRRHAALIGAASFGDACRGCTKTNSFVRRTRRRGVKGFPPRIDGCRTKSPLSLSS